MDTFQTISGESTGLYKDKGSKFYAYARRVNDVTAVQAFLTDIKELHPKARHHCYAYRIGLSGDSFRENDDGEPSGTAGKPIFGQLLSFGVTNTMVIVVRYFGGKLLGAGGLIRAYKSAAADALTNATVVTDVVSVAFKITATYSTANDVMAFINQPGYDVYASTFDEEPIFMVRVRKSEANLFVDQLKGIHGVSILPVDS